MLALSPTFCAFESAARRAASAASRCALALARSRAFSGRPASLGTRVAGWSNQAGSPSGDQPPHASSLTSTTSSWHIAPSHISPFSLVASASAFCASSFSRPSQPMPVSASCFASSLAFRRFISSIFIWAISSASSAGDAELGEVGICAADSGAAACARSVVVRGSSAFLWDSSEMAIWASACRCSLLASACTLASSASACSFASLPSACTLASSACTLASACCSFRAWASSSATAAPRRANSSSASTAASLGVGVVASLGVGVAGTAASASLVSSGAAGATGASSPAGCSAPDATVKPRLRRASSSASKTRRACSSSAASALTSCADGVDCARAAANCAASALTNSALAVTSSALACASGDAISA
mmetsp:Transcript_48218/g.115938  ORF Transcript_48218/g.115938 Transcript_48218/m.115938 type:complete len:366 (-) Transcript_48218:213-1310(-)